MLKLDRIAKLCRMWRELSHFSVHLRLPTLGSRLWLESSRMFDKAHAQARGTPNTLYFPH